ncbi:MAG TPA: site-specific integrase [Myxococcales bacterium]|nr:site-specific integrase [Myxococcales bacterium]
MLATLMRLDQDLVVKRSRRRARARGLPAVVIEDLYDIIRPDSARNPFRTEPLRQRNFVIVLLYLHQGLRRGELLQLPVDAIKEEFDPHAGQTRLWMNVEENPYERGDPRAARPMLKNEGAHRQTPISQALVDAVDTYVQNFRRRQSTRFMFCSQERKPLSSREVNKVFERLTRSLSADARQALWKRGAPARVTPQDLRHTCAAVRLNQLVGADEARLPSAIEQLRPFFGWVRDSEMPLLYARTYFEGRIAKVWNSAFDARVEFLRSVP